MSNPDALILMGCPEVPVQMSLVLYLSGALRDKGIDVFIAGNPAALNLARVADRKRCYLGRLIELERTIADIVEGRRYFGICFAFAHNDAGITYAATVRALLPESKFFLIIFGRNAEELAGTVDFDAEKVVERAVHNPLGLRKKIDGVLAWAV
ncbi:MAG TPA: DUF1890 domain-containing protein [Methanothrix sp.]|nr:DUF1890 domain-containing protein [Methanothrix sp.]HOK58830.1 DUF1890 domain-containing protein [Methanothrix sp.]HOL42788.1 DUF1890 domain-containing protein [Methanothrix sp.]HPO89047.1 DUF1890 domain-containing protein [Methanothrix sp.]